MHVPTRTAGVMLRSSDDTKQAVDPIGGVRFVRRALPLDVEIDKIGEAKITGPKRVDLRVFQGNDGIDLAPSSLDFVRGHFLTLSEAERLRAPDFAAFKAGFEISGGRLKVDEPSAITESYDCEILFIQPEPDRTEPAPIGPGVRLDAAVAARWSTVNQRLVALAEDARSDATRGSAARARERRRLRDADRRGRGRRCGYWRRAEATPRRRTDDLQRRARSPRRRTGRARGQRRDRKLRDFGAALGTTMATRFAFLPYAQSEVLAAAGVLGPSGRRQLGYDVEVRGDGAAQGARLPIGGELLGPGDITGINRSMVSRVEPRPGLTAFEPAYMPFVEFVDADFPWRYSLDRGSTTRIRPWLVLLALRADEFEFRDAGTGPLPRIQVSSSAKSCPDLGQSWAFAHVQVALTESAGSVAASLAASPLNHYSRLLCPRKLEERTGYNLFLVPAYEAGRLKWSRRSRHASNARCARVDEQVRTRACSCPSTISRGSSPTRCWTSRRS